MITDDTHIIRRKNPETGRTEFFAGRRRWTDNPAEARTYADHGRCRATCERMLHSYPRGMALIPTRIHGPFFFGES